MRTFGVHSVGTKSHCPHGLYHPGDPSAVEVVKYLIHPCRIGGRKGGKENKARRKGKGLCNAWQSGGPHVGNVAVFPLPSRWSPTHEKNQVATKPMPPIQCPKGRQHQSAYLSQTNLGGHMWTSCQRGQIAPAMSGFRKREQK